MTSTAELVRADQEYLIHPLHHPIDSADPIIYVRGRGVMVQDIEGHEYIDGLSGLWNVNIGHGRAELVEAAAAQMKELAYCSGFVGSSNIPSISLAERLVEITDHTMQAVFLTSGGAEANESAFKTARFYWKARGKRDKVKIIARDQAYHGLTLQTMSATGMGPGYWKMFEPRVPGFVHIQTCYPYRYQGAKADETIGQAAARELEEAILREGPDTVAAFVAEPIHGAGGVFYPTDDYWPRVREVCTRHELLLIADEIITGFCRTGRWFGLSHWNVKPDILSFAKGVTSGYLPLGGMMVTSAIKEAMDSVKPDDRWMHAYTNSGHPTCCAVALKNIEIMQRERLWENATQMGERLHAGLTAAFGDQPNTGDIRAGKGLLAAVEFVEDRATKKNFATDLRFAARLKAEIMKRGVITRTRPAVGPHPAPGDVLFFAPPLVVTEAEIDRLVDVARDAVDVVLRSRPFQATVTSGAGMPRADDIHALPPDLPVPADDGLAAHLAGIAVPQVSLRATTGELIDVAALSGWTVVYCYPRTGRPDQELPEGWNQIPGARGCTPQSCAFRDLYREFERLGIRVFGLSTQDTEYQREAAERLHLPFSLLSDAAFQFATAMQLPTFEGPSMRLLKRLTLIIREGIVEHVFYPVFPSDRNAQDVLDWLTSHPAG